MVAGSKPSGSILTIRIIGNIFVQRNYYICSQDRNHRRVTWLSVHTQCSFVPFGPRSPVNQLASSDSVDSGGHQLTDGQFSSFFEAGHPSCNALLQGRRKAQNLWACEWLLLFEMLALDKLFSWLIGFLSRHLVFLGEVRMILETFQDNDAAPDHDRLTALRGQILGKLPANQNHIRQLGRR